MEPLNIASALRLPPSAVEARKKTRPMDDVSTRLHLVLQKQTVSELARTAGFLRVKQ